MEFKASDEVLSDAQTGEPLGEVAPPKEDDTAQVQEDKAVTMDTRDTGSEELIAAKSAEALGNAVAQLHEEVDLDLIQQRLVAALVQALTVEGDGSQVWGRPMGPV